MRPRHWLMAATLAWALAGAAAPVGAQRIAAAPARATENPAPRTPPADAWLGEDKVRHFAASAAVTTLAYAGARIPFDDPDDAVVAAVGAAAVAGLMREIHDHRRGRVFSVRDLVWDALGITAGYFWIREIE